MDLLFYLIILLIPLSAELFVKANYKKYSQKKNSNGLSGFEVAKKILEKNDLNNIYVVETNGTLTDHYDPTRKTVKLSKDIFDGDSIAAMAIAAHECGHAIQDKEGYLLFKIRSSIVPVVNLGQRLSYILILIGVVLEYLAHGMGYSLIVLGIALVSLGLLFQLVTLPLELNASKRALNELETLNLESSEDEIGTKKMLKSAALTYVAAVLTSLLEVIRLILIYGNRKD